MTQEEKDLLLKDLSARLPYDVKVLYNNKVFSIDYVSCTYEEVKLYNNYDYCILNISVVKPYLFPLSSMTEEQLFDVQEILGKNEIKIEDSLIRIVDFRRKIISYLEILALLEWFYKNHFDINNLIPAGLAIDATGLNIY